MVLGLSQRLVLIVVPLVLLPLLALSAWSFGQLREREVERVRGGLEVAVGRLALDVRGEMDDAQRNLLFFAQTALVRNYAGTTDERKRFQLLQPTVIDFLEEVRATFPQFRDIRLLAADGSEDTRVAETSMPEVAPPAGPWLEDLRSGRRDAFMGVVRMPGVAEPKLLLARRIQAVDPSPDPRHGVRPTTGLLVVVHDLAFIQSLVSRAAANQDGQFHLLDRREGLVASSSAIPLAADAPAHLRDALPLEEAASGAEPDSGEQSSLVRKVMPHLYVVGELVESKLGEVLGTLAWSFGKVSLLAGVVSAVLLSLLLRRTLVAPLLQLIRATVAIGEERQVAGLPTRRGDELGLLARALEGMRDTLASRRQALSAQNQLLAHRAQELEQARDAALEADRAKTMFLGVMSHELRTPLGGVLGMSELLQGTSLDPTQRSWVDTVQQCGRSLLGLIDDLLNYVELGNGALSLQKLPLDPVAISERVIAALVPAAETKGLALRLHAEPGSRQMLLGDAERLFQLLLKLCDNAVKFTRQGEVVLSLSQPLRGGLRIEIRDTGPGIAPDLQEKLFEPFWQASSGMDRAHGGIGLGLTLARLLTDVMGGSLQLSNSVDGGAVVLLELPLQPA